MAPRAAAAPVELAFKTGKASPNWYPIASLQDDVVVRQLLADIPRGNTAGHAVFIAILAAVGAAILLRRLS
jgi:hypothetical protein